MAKINRGKMIQGVIYDNVDINNNTQKVIGLINQRHNDPVYMKALRGYANDMSKETNLSATTCKDYLLNCETIAAVIDYNGESCGNMVIPRECVSGDLASSLSSVDISNSIIDDYIDSFFNINQMNENSNAIKYDQVELRNYGYNTAEKMSKKLDDINKIKLEADALPSKEEFLGTEYLRSISKDNFIIPRDAIKRDSLYDELARLDNMDNICKEFVNIRTEIFENNHREPEDIDVDNISVICNGRKLTNTDEKRKALMEIVNFFNGNK